MGAFYGIEKQRPLNRISSTQLEMESGALLKLGGLVHSNSQNLTLDITQNGEGGLDTGSVQSGTLYYVYAVYTNAMNLVASTSKEKPSGFTRYRKVGAFEVVRSTPEILVVYSYRDTAINSYQVHVGLGSTVASNTYLDWIETISRSGSNNYQITITPKEGLFSFVPNGYATANHDDGGGRGLITNYDYDLSTVDSLIFKSRGSDGVTTGDGTRLLVKRAQDFLLLDWRHY